MVRTASPATDGKGQLERLRGLHLYYRHFGASSESAEMVEVLRRGLEVHDALERDPEDLLLRLWQWSDLASGAEPARRLLPALRFMLERCAEEESGLIPALWAKRGAFERELGAYGAALESTREGRRLIRALAGKVSPAMDAWMQGNLPYIEAERFVIQLELGLLTEASRTLEAQAEAAEELDDSAAWMGLGIAINRARLAYFHDRFRAGIQALEGPEIQELLRLHGEQDPADLAQMTSLVSLWRAVCLARSNGALRDQARVTFERLLEEGSLQDNDAAQARRHLAEILIEDGEYSAALELLPRRVSQANSRTTLDVVEYRSLRAKAARRAGWSGERLLPLLTDLEESYRDFLRIWRACPRPPSGVGFLQYPPRRSIVAELIELHLLVHPGELGRSGALGALLQAQACGTLSVEIGAQAGDIEAIRKRLLGSEGGLLAVLAGPEACHLFALDGQDLSYRRLAGEQSLRRGLRGLLPFRPSLDALGRVTAEEQSRYARVSSAQGQRWFDGDLGGRILGWNQVSMTGAENFGMTAVEGLALDTEGTRLGDLPLTHLPSIAWALAQAPDPAQEGLGNLVVLAAPQLRVGLGLSPIKLDKQHVRAWLAAIPADRSRVFLGEEATLEQLADDPVRAADALLIYTHGGYDSEEERPSSLWLASEQGPSRQLFAGGVEEVFSKEGRSAPGLVILAACGAQRGPLRLGEDGVQHLGGAFLRSGSRCVVLSAADLDQESTRVMVGLLFEQLAEPGGSPAAAMAKARAALASDPRFAHPYYYGQLTVSGLGHGLTAR